VKDQVPEAMPQCFENWCRRFDDLFSRRKQRQAFRTYVGGLLGESQRKNVAQIGTNTVDATYNSLRHFDGQVILGCGAAQQPTARGDGMPSDKAVQAGVYLDCG